MLMQSYLSDKLYAFQDHYPHTVSESMIKVAKCTGVPASKFKEARRHTPLILSATGHFLFKMKDKHESN